jgi:hydroxymethylpyrimidine pyrophosphatase-like HAD family hydrolase
VAGAHPEVAAIADATCPGSNDEDGVAQVLETLLAG